MVISFLRVLLSFCFDWEDISNTQQCFISFPDTLNFTKNSPVMHSYFQLSSWCFWYPDETRSLVFDRYITPFPSVSRGLFLAWSETKPKKLYFTPRLFKILFWTLCSPKTANYSALMNMPLNLRLQLTLVRNQLSSATSSLNYQKFPIKGKPLYLEPLVSDRNLWQPLLKLKVWNFLSFLTSHMRPLDR